MKKIVVIGTGAWGTAIADLLANNNHIVNMYGIENEVIYDINTNHKNTKYFGDRKINTNIIANSDLFNSLTDVDIIVLAVPSKTIKNLIVQIKSYINENILIVNLSKGFEFETGKTLSQMILSLLPYNYRKNYVTLVGPSFAEEVIERQYTAVVSSSYSYESSKIIQKVFSNDYFRVYVNSDVIGVEYCSALKNVIALACGLVTGLGCKDNTKAALISRGMNEIKKYVTYFGGDEKTCLGLAGYGDLILTCTSYTSRNFTAGKYIGEKGTKEFFKNNKYTVEGIIACEVAYNISKKYNLYVPIIESIYNVLFNDYDPRDEMVKLMSKKLKDE